MVRLGASTRLRWLYPPTVDTRICPPERYALEALFDFLCEFLVVVEPRGLYVSVPLHGAAVGASVRPVALTGHASEPLHRARSGLRWSPRSPVASAPVEDRDHFVAAITGDGPRLVSRRALEPGLAQRELIACLIQLLELATPATPLASKLASASCPMAGVGCDVRAGDLYPGEVEVARLGSLDAVRHKNFDSETRNPALDEEHVDDPSRGETSLKGRAVDALEREACLELL